MRTATEWAYLPQSEERVVAKQIKERSRQDAAYLAGKEGGSVLETVGGFGIREDVLCTYVDLERQIRACDFDRGRQEILNLLMEGYSLRDIAEMKSREIREVERSFRNAVYEIVRQNNRRWEEVYLRQAC